MESAKSSEAQRDADRAPATPAGFTATAGAGLVTLSWTASTGATGYNLYRGTATGAESTTPLNATPVTGTTYTDASVAAGTKYYYKVAALGPGNGTSGQSTEKSATPTTPTPPSPPTNLAATATARIR